MSMIKLTHMIVDSNFNLIGFVAEGSAKEFGLMGDEVISQSLSLKRLFESNFSNKQISVKNGIINEKTGFKLNTIGMVKMDGNRFIPIKNEITLVSRYVQNNKNVGFGALIGEDPTEYKFTTDNIVRICDRFKPINFVVRNYGENKRAIVGKRGSSIDELPAIQIGSTKTKRSTTPLTTVDGGVSTSVVHNVDIFDLYEFIREVGGYIVNMPGSKYSAHTNANTTHSAFVSYGFGEVGSPWLDFHESKFNINCNFKRPGEVVVKMPDGSQKKITTFVYRKKSIFFNGAHNIEKLGVIIPTSAEGELLSRFGSSMSLTEIPDKIDTGIVSVISGVVGDIKLYEVDVSKVSMMSEDKARKFVLNSKDLKAKVFEYNTNKMIAKYLNGLSKELKALVNVDNSNKKPIHQSFSMMSTEELKCLIEHGIDIYTGAFMLENQNKSTSKTGGSSTSTSEMEALYGIDGLNANNLTYKQMVECGPKVPAFLQGVVGQMNSIEDFKGRGDKARAMLDIIESKNSKLRYEIWMHKCAMYVLSNKRGLHSHDRANWIVNESKRTKAKCYKCAAADCSGLQITVDNIDLV